MPRLFKTDTVFQADIKVFVTDIRGEADLIIYETEDSWKATKSAIWTYTDIQSEAEKTIFITSSEWEADLVVYKTDIESDAGWMNPSKSEII